MPNDILLTDEFDLFFEDGDFVIGESTEQHQALLLLIDKGELREFPQRGVGLRTWINDDNDGDLNAAIKREFEADGMKVLAVQGRATKLRVEAIYEEG